MNWILKKLKQLFNKPNNINSNNFNNFNTFNMSDNLILITPGFYQHKSTLNSDTPNIIRIMGKNSNSEDSYLSIDGISYSVYELQNNWVQINAGYSKEVGESELLKRKKEKQILFEDFDKIENSPIIEYSQKSVVDELFTELEEFNSSTVDLSNQILPKVLTEVIPIDTEKQFIISLLDKSKLNNTNKQLTVNFNFNQIYDFVKVKNSIELLDIDISKLVPIMVNAILGSDINNLRIRLSNQLTIIINDLLKQNTNESHIEIDKTKVNENTKSNTESNNESNTLIDNKLEMIESKNQELDNELNNYLESIEEKLKFFRNQNKLNQTNTEQN